MCGIVGFTTPGQDPAAAKQNVQGKAALIRHRGPDGEGCYAAGTAALGHRRLSVIDLAGGGQPMRNEDGSLVVVFNGEIYNYKTLRARLQQRGHTFATDSDTEVLLHGYEEWGRDLPCRLRGMFAFAVWARKRGTLFCARDLFGIKPLVRSIHAGLECGLFLRKYPWLEMVSFGPTLRGVHSPDERLEIASVDKFWKLLTETLKMLE